jgi:HlyD family secretion protein
MQVHSDIAESDVGKIKEGQDVTFRVDAFPKEEFTGRVSQVRNEGKIVQNVVTYDAVIDVENKELKLKPGMTAYVSILVAKNENALKIPNTALRFKPSKTDEEKKPDSASKGSSSPAGSRAAQAKGASAAPSSFDQPVIWLRKGNKPIPVKVKIGITDGKNSEVVEGDIAEGDEVITEELNSGKKDAATMPGFGGRGFR